MRIEQCLRRNQKAVVSAAGSSVLVRAGDRVLIVCKPSGHTYDLDRGDQMTLPNGLEFDTLEITNLGSEENITLAHFYGDLKPTIDGSKMNIIDTASIEVSFPSRQPVELPSNQHVVATVDNLPDVQKVEITNQVEPVAVQNVAIVGRVEKPKQFQALDTILVTKAIKGNANRLELLLTAAAENEDAIWLGGVFGKGIKLMAGNAFVLTNGAAIDVLVPAGCQLYAAEVVVL